MCCKEVHVIRVPVSCTPCYINTVSQVKVCTCNSGRSTGIKQHKNGTCTVVSYKQYRCQE